MGLNHVIRCKGIAWTNGEKGVRLGHGEGGDMEGHGRIAGY